MTGPMFICDHCGARFAETATFGAHDFGHHMVAEAAYFARRAADALGDAGWQLVRTALDRHLEELHREAFKARERDRW